MWNRNSSTLELPPLESVQHLEGKGNWAVKKYYEWPYSFFYQQKLRMILKILDDYRPFYWNILDFGSGSGILKPELSKRCMTLKSVNSTKEMNYYSMFESVVCGSVLEFCELSRTIPIIKSVMKRGSILCIASPMKTPISELYFRSIGDNKERNHHKSIVEYVSTYLHVTSYTEWHGLYFSIGAILE